MSEFDHNPSKPTSLFPEPFFVAHPELPPEMRNYQIVSRIGYGSFGTVYEAAHIMRYAVKIIPWSDSYPKERALLEYKNACLFQDVENTLHVFAYYEHNQASYLLQEIGEPYLPYFSNHTPSLRNILEVLLDIAHALSAIHEKGFSHFDVKPNNIIIVDGKAKLGDFSLCLDCKANQTYGKSVGTKSYRAPEVEAGFGITGKEDMYSLGVTMFSLLMGGHPPVLRPEEKMSDVNSISQIKTLFLHPDLLCIIQKAAAFEHTDRYASFEAFSADIKRFMDFHQEDLDETVLAYLPARSGATTLTPVELS